MKKTIVFLLPVQAATSLSFIRHGGSNSIAASTINPSVNRNYPALTGRELSS